MSFSGQRSALSVTSDRIRDQLVEADVGDDLRYCLDNRMITMFGYRGHGNVGFGSGITDGLIEFTVLCDALLINDDGRVRLEEQR